MSKARDLANAGTALTTVSATELGYLDGVTSAVQTQLNAKQATVSGVNDTEIGYLDGVTSAIQTQLNQKPEFTAGKNKIINGNFGVWQRGTSFSISTYGYTADRWQSDATLAYPTSRTVSQQSFTPGTAPVAGYEGSFFLRTVYTYAPGNPGLYISQKIEDVRTFAGQTVTVSFWAKVGSAASLDNATILQNFGTGGSTSVQTTVGAASATTSWQRFSFTVSIPSIAGKTIGTDSNLELRIFMPNASSTTDIWGVQVEAGSTATAFQTATGTLQGELAACQRYYWRVGASNSALGTGAALSTSGIDMFVTLKVTMRTDPTTLDFSGLLVGDGINAATAFTSVTIFGQGNGVGLTGAASSLTNGRFYTLRTNSSGYLGIGAEL